MARRRRTQWIDAINTGPITVLGAIAPGTLNEETMVSEGEMENIGGGATLIRTVGEIWTLQSVGAPAFTHTLFLAQNFVGATFPADWDADAFQRQQVLGTWMGLLDAGSNRSYRHSIDLRSKRKLTQGLSLTLSTQNHRTAGHDLQYAFHLRMLLLLP